MSTRNRITFDALPPLDLSLTPSPFFLAPSDWMLAKQVARAGVICKSKNNARVEYAVSPFGIEFPFEFRK